MELDLALLIAKDEKIEMTPEHWEVVNFLREYYDEYQIAPAIRVLTKALEEEDGRGEVLEQISLRALPLRPGQAGVQDRRAAEADRLRLTCRTVLGATEGRVSRSGSSTRRGEILADDALRLLLLRRDGDLPLRHGAADHPLRPYARALEDPDHAGCRPPRRASPSACCAR